MHKMSEMGEKGRFLQNQTAINSVTQMFFVMVVLKISLARMFTRVQLSEKDVFIKKTPLKLF